MGKLRILLVEDCPTDALIVRHALRMEYEVEHVVSVADARQRLLDSVYVAVITDHGLKTDTGLELPYEIPGYRHVYHLYVVETERRDDLLGFLQDSGIDAKTHYPIAIHQQEGYPWGQPADMDLDLPNTESNAARCVTLPMYPELRDDELQYVVDKVHEWDTQNK